jgi:heparinase II/III-like protein
MKRIRWYFARVNAMSFREVAHRIHELAVKNLSRVVPPSVDVRTIGWTENSKPLGDLILNQWGSDTILKSQWQRESNLAVLEGPLVFGIRWPLFHGVPQWHAALPSESNWPLKYCFDINFRSPGQNGEARLAWELNRLLWLIPIAATAVYENDKELADWCWTIVESWNTSNPPFRGICWATGIECALQIFALATIEDLLSRVAPSQSRRSTISTCIALRAKWIRRFPSKYSSANNHSLAELAGRLVASLVIDDESNGDDPRDLLREFQGDYRTQHCADGMNREQAPHYGLFVLELAALCTELCCHAGITIDETWQKSLRNSARVLDLLQDEGGNLLCFGDNDGSGILSSCLSPNKQVNSIAELAGFSVKSDVAKPPLVVLGEEWYTVCRSNDVWGPSMWTIDHASLGYGNLAAHGHADALAIWLSVDGRPVFIESGTYIYHSDEAWRNNFRSTHMHNTLSVEGKNSSEMNGPFNWSQRSRAKCRIWSHRDSDDWVVEAEHDGYLKAFGTRHFRRLSRISDGHFLIEDSLDGTVLRQSQFTLVLAPDIESIQRDDGWILLRDGKALGDIRYFGDFVHSSERGNADSGRGWVSDIFMTRLPTTQLFINGTMGASRVLRVEISARAR